jgi:uncharacterized membrane protein YcjF (UPF0283 family)
VIIPAWSPEAWNSFGVVGVVVFMGVLLFVALTREWIVIGRYHRDVVSRLDARAVKDADAIETLSRAISEKNATEDATTRILAALRETLTVKGGEH